MTEDYCKLASGIILSTIWQEDSDTRVVWITMLAVKNRKHEVLASLPGLASVAKVSVEACERALHKFLQPDPYSRTKEHEGRRIEIMDGGWRILNGEKYRNFLSKAERNEYQRLLMAERRKKAKQLAPVSTPLARLAHTDTEADTDTGLERTAERSDGANYGSPPERPSLDDVRFYAQSIGLAEWKAVDWFDEMEACGWIDHLKRPVKDWRAMLRRVRVKWEADGRPSGPPANKYENNERNSKPNPRNAGIATDQADYSRKLAAKVASQQSNRASVPNAVATEVAQAGRGKPPSAGNG